MIQKLISGIFFFWKCYFGHATFLRTFLWTSSEFFLISDFLAGSLKANKNYRKRSLIFQYGLTQNTSLISLTSTHLILKIIYSQNTIKNLSHFTNFPVNIFLFGVRKKICNGPFLDTQELHSSSALKANVYAFLYISLRKFLLQRRSKILSVGIGGGWRLNNFLNAAHCLDIVKCFTMFHLNWNFWKFSSSTSPMIP